MSNQDNILEIIDIEKQFFGVQVLKKINFQLRRGEILGLVGENGAGKSTMMNVIGGIYQRDNGKMLINGATYEPQTSKDATDNGIAFIHQELNLFTNLSISENMFIEEFPKNTWRNIDFRYMHNKASQALKDYGLSELSPKTIIKNLPMGTRQIVEIIKSLMKKAKIMIFDEPTTSLSAPEKEKLFQTINDLRDSGISIIFISHILEDVMYLCDRVTVLRDGEIIGSRENKDLCVNEIITMMVGRELNNLYPEFEHTVSTDVALELKDISRNQKIQDISFTLHKGEILGLYGIIGAGRTELAKCIFGIDKIDSGEIFIRGRKVDQLSPEKSIAEGIAFVTEDRRHEGLFMPKSVSLNSTIVNLKNILSKFGVINRTSERISTREMVDNLRIKVSDVNKLPVANLSGGNQQKVVFGKWVMNNPSIFILDEPTKGVDVGAKYEIYSIIGDMTKNGAAVLVISSEMEELIGIADRILVMKKGRLSGEVMKKDFTQEKIGSMAL